MKTPEQRRHWRRFDVFIVNFEHISHLALVFLLLTLNMQLLTLNIVYIYLKNNFNKTVIHLYLFI